MTLEEQLKNEILSRYKSVRAFTTSINVPYSTLDSVFKRGIANAGVSTMIKVFDALDLDIESIVFGELRHRDADKNSPDTTEDAPGEDLTKIFNYLQDSLIAAGFLKKGQDLTERQADVLIAICQIIHATFSD